MNEQKIKEVIRQHYLKISCATLCWVREHVKKYRGGGGGVSNLVVFSLEEIFKVKKDDFGDFLVLEGGGGFEI